MNIETHTCMEGGKVIKGQSEDKKWTLEIKLGARKHKKLTLLKERLGLKTKVIILEGK